MSEERGKYEPIDEEAGDPLPPEEERVLLFSIAVISAVSMYGLWWFAFCWQGRFI